MKSENLSPQLFLDPFRVQTLKISSAETILFLDEAKVNNKKRTLMLTNSCFYLLKKHLNGKWKIKSVTSLFLFSDLQLLSDSTIQIYFSTEMLLISSSNAGVLQQILWDAVLQLGWNPYNPSTFFSFFNYNATSRPSNLLTNRYIALCVMQSLPIENEIISLFNSYDENPQKCFTFSDVEIESTIVPIFKALSLETQLKTIEFDDCLLSRIDEAINYCFTQPFPAVHYIFSHFEVFPTVTISCDFSPTNEIESITINQCTSSFYRPFIQSLQNISFSPKTFCLKDCTIGQSDLQTLATAIHNYTFFSKILSYIFENLSGNGSIVSLINLFDNQKAIETLQITNSHIDLSEFFTIFSTISTKIRNLILRKNQFPSVIPSLSKLPKSVVYLDVGDCEWNSRVIFSFLSMICHEKRSLPLILKIDHCQPYMSNWSSWEEIFSNILRTSIYPVITELDISRNKLGTKSFLNLFKFLETQYPNEGRFHFQFLNLDNCFNGFSFSSEELPLFNNILQNLVNFYTTHGIYGLSIQNIIPHDCPSDFKNCFSQLIKSFCQTTKLYYLDISGNYIIQSAIKYIIDFIQTSSTISEFGLDKTGIKDQNLLLQLYDSIFSSSKLLSFTNPITDLEIYKNHPIVSNINQKLDHKSFLSTSFQRLHMYFEESKCVCRSSISNPTSTFSFRNPHNSFLKTNSVFAKPSPTQSPFDSIVTDYFNSFQERFGLLPPSSAPASPPPQPLRLPSIFISRTYEGDRNIQIFDNLMSISNSLSDKFRELMDADILMDEDILSDFSSIKLMETDDNIEYLSEAPSVFASDIESNDNGILYYFSETSTDDRSTKPPYTHTQLNQQLCKITKFPKPPRLLPHPEIFISKEQPETEISFSESIDDDSDSLAEKPHEPGTLTPLAPE